MEGNPLNNRKGCLSVISSYPPCIDTRFTTVPLKEMEGNPLNKRKGCLSVISSYPRCIAARFTTVPLKEMEGNPLNNRKGCLSVISSYPPCIDTRFTTVPLKALSDQARMKHVCFVLLNCSFSFLVSVEKLLAHFLILRSNEKYTERYTFWVGKTTLSSTFLIRLRIQGYCCKSGIAIFEWRFTYSTFKNFLKFL